MVTNYQLRITSYRFQLIHLAIFPSQVVDIRANAQRPAGGFLDNLGGGELGAVGVQVVGEPAAQAGELAMLDIGRDLRAGLERRREKLRAQNIAQSVALENAAHLAGVPV